MKIDLAAVNGLNYDYVIVGTGPAGISLALGLSKKNLKILLLEGGLYKYTEKSQQLYEGEIVGGPYHNLKSTRLRYFGGSSNHWTGTCRPLDDIDFEKFPINKETIQPYLSEASKILEIDGRFSKDKILNDNFTQIEFQYSPPVRFNKKYRGYIEQSKLIDLALNANVLSIREDDEGNNADYLEVATIDNIKHKIYVNNLIVACGGIENSRLLLWSQYVNKKLLTGLPIGSNWMEHPHFSTGSIIGYNSKINKIFDPTIVPSRNNVYLQPTSTLMKRYGINNAGIRLKFDTAKKENSLLKSLIKDVLCVAPEFGKELMSLADRNLICGVAVRMAWEQEARIENRIELDFKKVDQYGVPKIKLNWQLNQQDKKTAEVCMKMLGELFLEKDLGRVGILPYLKNEDEFPVNDEIGGHHHMGGTAMSSSGITGVVDSNLKIFNVNNVWVAGSSVFPAGGHANPTLTIVQLSLRLANHLTSLNG